MNTPEQEIEIAQRNLKQIHARLSSFFEHYWDCRIAPPEEIAAVNSAIAAINEAVAKVQILKEKM